MKLEMWAILTKILSGVYGNSWVGLILNIWAGILLSLLTQHEQLFGEYLNC